MNNLLKSMLICCVTTILSVHNLSAQEVWEDWTEQLATGGEDDAARWEAQFEALSELREHPLNLNTATREQLEQFPFLSDQMVEDILYYLYKHGPMLTVNELWGVKDMDRRILDILRPFVYVEAPEKEERKPTLKRILKYGKQELSTRVDIPFYTKAGYADYPLEVLKRNPNKRYIGYGYYHNLRYSFRYRDQVYVGLIAENDAGEPFFARHNNKGYDFYSPYLLIRNIGKIKALALGNYRLSYGFGLVMNTDFSMGKTNALATLSTKGRGIKKHSSTDEYNYFQGVAVSYRLSRRWTLDGFYSYRRMDGTVDSLFIRSLKKDGYHRLPREVDKKNLFNNQLAGSHLDYNGKYLKVGLTAVYNVFNKELNPEKKYYNTYYPRGNHFYNVGADYTFFWKRFALHGETAIDKGGAVATLNTLRYSPKREMQLIVMNRYYDMRYQAIYARAVGEGSSVQNEQGVYIGLETKLLRYVQLTCYADFFSFPWRRYLVSKLNTKGVDGLVQLTYSPIYELDMFIRYRYRNKAKDLTMDDGEKQTLPYIQQKFRYQLNYRPGSRLLLKTLVDYARVNDQHQPVSSGVLASQSVSYRFASFPLRMDVAGTWFRTDDYQSRLSLYERNVLYAFSIPSFYGHGMRWSVNAGYEPSSHLVLQAKYGLTHYWDRDKIGSALEEIEGSTKSDLCVQLRWKF